MFFTTSQTARMNELAGNGAPITGATIHPYSGAMTLSNGRETVAMIAPNGAVTYVPREYSAYAHVDAPTTAPSEPSAPGMDRPHTASRATPVAGAVTLTGDRCRKCGEIGADPDLGNVCLECDYAHA